MHPIESNIEAVLVAIPMLLVMFASFFKLDEAIFRPAKPKARVRRFSEMNEDGQFICVEPDGSRPRSHRARYAYGTMTEAGPETAHMA